MEDLLKAFAEACAALESAREEYYKDLTDADWSYYDTTKEYHMARSKRSLLVLNEYKTKAQEAYSALSDAFITLIKY